MDPKQSKNQSPLWTAEEIRTKCMEQCKNMSADSKRDTKYVNCVNEMAAFYPSRDGIQRNYWAINFFGPDLLYVDNPKYGDLPK